MQMILTSEYTSFSLFGLLFTYIVGCVLIVSSYVLEPIHAYLERRRQSPGYSYFEWNVNATLQLQRLAYQGLGSGEWGDYEESIPKTKEAEPLVDLVSSYWPAKNIRQGKISPSNADWNASISENVTTNEPVLLVTQAGSVRHHRKAVADSHLHVQPLEGARDSISADGESGNDVWRPYMPEPSAGGSVGENRRPATT
jgi:hypothetical protein